MPTDDGGRVAAAARPPGVRTPALVAAAPAVFVLLWSTGFVVARYGTQDAGPLTFLGLRTLVATLLLVAASFFIWMSRAQPDRVLGSTSRPSASSGASLLQGAGLPAPPAASEESREEKRFSRADKNKDGKIESEELLNARRKAFAKLDANGNGALSFEEWAAKTIGKFQGADKDRSGFLTAAEYATTAPPPPKHKMCSCGSAAPASYASNDD